MKADVEMVITYDGKQWVARNDAFPASGETLPELDTQVADALRQQGDFGKPRVTVFMGFDSGTIPTWIRQYASHYFNRYIFVDL